jgi:NNP family nitrate/nitrite transporter-like MFS transporter
MPSTSLFYPKKKMGTALAVQAGIGNFGVSLVQFITPVVIGMSIVGGSQAFQKKPDVPAKDIYLQNAVLLWIPLVLIGSILAWTMLRAVPVKANMREQMDIFREHKTYQMTGLYIMTFGAFSGLAAAFPLLIEKRFGGFENAPDPLTYAFIGPLVGSLMRVVAGPISDRFGGAKVTHYAAIGMTVFAAWAATLMSPDSRDDFTLFVIAMVGIFFFAGVGNASVFKQIPGLFDVRKTAGVVGWTAAVAAYGPFFVSVLISFSVSTWGSPAAFFIGLAVFCAVNVVLNWWFFARKNAPYPC